MAPALTFLILTLCAARLTRIITADTITESWRFRIFRRYPPSRTARRGPHPIGQLIDCPWCIGWWISGACVLVASRFVSIPIPLFWWPAVAWAQAVVAVKLDG